MPTYVRNEKGIFVDKKTGEPMKPETTGLATPMIMKPMPDYKSPIDGRLITSRQARKDDLKKHGCVPYEPSMSPTKGTVKNPKYAGINGLKLKEE